MSEIVYDTLSDAINAISKVKLNPEDGAKFIDILTTWYGTAKTKELVKKRKISSDAMRVKFGPHLRNQVLDGPKLPADMIEPLRECGARLAADKEIAIEQIVRGFKKNPT